MKQIRILLAVAILGIVGCRAQEGVPAAAPVQPGLPPLALADIVVVETDSLNNSIAALTNDIDVSGTGLTITTVTVDQTLPPMAGATATTDGNTVTFTPPATFTGVVTLQYSISDGAGGTSSATIAVSVLPVALPPVALPDAATVAQDSGPNDIDVLANDVDLAGGGLTVTAVAVNTSLPPAAHTVAVVGNQVRFTPAAGFVGVVLVDYTATDVNGESADGVLSIVVSPLAVAVGPVAVPDAELVAQDSTNNDIDVLANDVDSAGGGLTVSNPVVTASVPNVAHTVSVVANQVRFTPAAGFVGTVVVTYTATDINGNSADGVLSIVVSPLALPPVGPVPVPDAAVVVQDSVDNDIDVLANDVDPAGGGLTVSNPVITASVPNVPHTISVAGNQVRFTPAAGFVGTVVVTYTATDINGNSADGVLSIVVSPLNLAVGPVPVPDAVVVAQDSANNDIDVLANDVDSAGGGLTVSNPVVTASVPNVAHTVSVAGNQVRFTPAAGFAGTVVVTYTATDINGESADGVLTIVVSPLALPVGPVAIPDAATVMQDSVDNDIDVLANDVDSAGGGLTLSNPVITASVPNVAHTISVVANQVRFTPAAGFAGTVVVTYTATDINGESADGVLTIVVSPLDLPVGPVPVPDAATVMQDSADNDIDVLGNDVDPAGGGLTLSNPVVTASVPNAVHTVSVAGNLVRFTPAAGFAGNVVVTYTATDINGESADGVLNIVVSPLALPVGPVAIPDAAVVPQDSAPTSIDVLANDIDFAGGGLTLSTASVFSSLPAALHTVAIVGNQVQFTPEAAFAGVVVVSYTATDVNGVTSNGLLNIEVTPTPLVIGPLAIPDADVASSSAGAQLFDVLANDVDPAAGGLTLTNVSLMGTPALNAGAAAIVGNQVEYTPVLTYIGIVVITYDAEDINGNPTTSQLTLTVSP